MLRNEKNFFYEKSNLELLKKAQKISKKSPPKIDVKMLQSENEIWLKVRKKKNYFVYTTLFGTLNIVRKVNHSAFCVPIKYELIQLKNIKFSDFFFLISKKIKKKCTIK